MGWRPIDFQGIIDLDQKIVEQLEQFLQEKENCLALQILEAVSPSLDEPDIPSSSIKGNEIKLSKAVEEFSKKVRFIVKSDVNSQQGNIQVDQIIKKFNTIFWEFTEVLEGIIIELFQEVKQISIDRWHLSIAHVVHEIKDILIHYIEDLIWTIRRLEKPLQELCEKFDLKPDQSWLDWILSKKTYLDRNLLLNLQESEKFLKNQYETFQQRYREFMLLNVKAEESLEKMKTYPALALMDMANQNLYIDLYRLLKMIELNRYPKKEVALDTSKALKRLAGADNILHILHIYYSELKDALFNCSLEWKSLDPEEMNFQEGLEKLKMKVKDYQQELRDLTHTMSQYRNFILKNNPNPYMRSRWGFSETIVGPEPAKSKKAMELIFSAEELGEYFTQLSASLARDSTTQQNIEYQAHQEIEKLLHEMGQPLISRSMMRNRVERLLEGLKACDEIGSPHMSTIDYVEDVLAKVMRIDWRYHVVHEFQLFHQIYRYNLGLIETFEDPSHAFRIERFYLLFEQIEKWLQKKDVYPNVREIELDLNDMKAYLQDFLAVVQRAVREKSENPFLDETRFKLRHQLLEYRYLFGQFFLDIISKNSDGMQLRNQFLFVDQYFESVENLLNELKVSWEGKR